MADPLSRRASWIQKLADQIVEGIAGKIRRGELKTGDPLGNRAELADEYVTSTNVIDRAVEKLIDDGTVQEDEQGEIRVAGFPAPEQGFELPRSNAATRRDILQILELRIGVEAVAAALAAERGSDGQIQAIRDAARDYEDVVSAGSGAGQADFRFHRSVAAASGNEYILDLIDVLGPLLIPRLRVTPPEPEGSDGEENLRMSVAEHGEIVEALAARDPDASRAAMRNHLSRTLALMKRLED